MDYPVGYECVAYTQINLLLLISGHAGQQNKYSEWGSFWTFYTLKN